MGEDGLKSQIQAGTGLTFIIPIDKVIEGKILKGEFELRCPAIKDTIAIGVLAARYRQNAPMEALDNQTLLASMGIATVQTLVVKRPDWAKDLSVLPEEVLLSVYAGFDEQLATFRDAGTKKDS